MLTTGSAEQTVSNLVPGNRVELTVIIAGVSGLAYVELNGIGGVQPINGSINIANGITITRTAIVPESGIVTVLIENRSSINVPIYVDDVHLCEIAASSCG